MIDVFRIQLGNGYKIMSRPASKFIDMFDLLQKGSGYPDRKYMEDISFETWIARKDVMAKESHHCPSLPIVVRKEFLHVISARNKQTKILGLTPLPGLNAVPTGEGQG